nr:uncharacterized protein LOC109185201 [Ipomoea batatas]
MVLTSFDHSALFLDLKGQADGLGEADIEVHDEYEDVPVHSDDETECSLEQFNHALEDTDFESNYEAENEMEIEDNEDLNEGVTQEFDVGFDAAEEDLNKDVVDYGSDAYYYDSTDPPSYESEEDVEREPISTHKKVGGSLIGLVERYLRLNNAHKIVEMVARLWAIWTARNDALWNSKDSIGFGAIIRDYSGRFVAAYNGRLSSCEKNPYLAETMARTNHLPSSSKKSRRRNQCHCRQQRRTRGTVREKRQPTSAVVLALSPRRGFNNVTKPSLPEKENVHGERRRKHQYISVFFNSYVTRPAPFLLQAPMSAAHRIPFAVGHTYAVEPSPSPENRSKKTKSQQRNSRSSDPTPNSDANRRRRTVTFISCGFPQRVSHESELPIVAAWQ